MLFIDQPVTVGFSYSKAINGYKSGGDVLTLPGNSCPEYASDAGKCGTYSYGNATLTANSTANAAPNMWKALQGFMGAFPQVSVHRGFVTSSCVLKVSSTHEVAFTLQPRAMVDTTAQSSTSKNYSCRQCRRTFIVIVIDLIIRYFEKQNMKNISGAHKISLESVAIGVSLIDPDPELNFWLTNPHLSRMDGTRP